jgi:hypothetical protein
VIEVGSRSKRLPAPPHVVWESLTEPRRSGARPWFEIDHDQVEPRVLRVEEPLLVWSSLWPDRPSDQVEIRLAPDGNETRLGFRLLVPDDDPLDADTAAYRSRWLSRLFFADLRESYGQ